MNIKINKDKEDILKVILGVEDLTETIEKVLDDWANTQIERKSMTIEEKITFLNNKLK